QRRADHERREVQATRPAQVAGDGQRYGAHRNGQAATEAHRDAAREAVRPRVGDDVGAVRPGRTEGEARRSRHDVPPAGEVDFVDDEAGDVVGRLHVRPEGEIRTADVHLVRRGDAVR